MNSQLVYLGRVGRDDGRGTFVEDGANATGLDTNTDPEVAGENLLLHLLKLQLLLVILDLLLLLNLLLNGFLFLLLAPGLLLLQIQLPVVVIARVLLLQLLR